MIYKQKIWNDHYGIFTDGPIQKHSILFSYSEWIWDEQYGWEVLTVEEINSLSPQSRYQFLKYAYDIDFGKTIGTFDWSRAIGLSNYMNHSCDPNLIYDMDDNILARRDIQPHEELTIDYGTFVVNVDQDFICNCGSVNCRSIIKKDDWKILIPKYGYGFPRFMHNAITLLLENQSQELA